MNPVDIENDASVIPAQFWHPVQHDLIQCDLCPRLCQLKENQRGFCYIRVRNNNQMWLTSYGRSSGFCIDPIEKKPLNHFLPGSAILSFGTAGCNLACKFCQNWDMSKARSMDRLMDQAQPEMLAKAALKYSCSAVAYTYNDPVIFYEYALDTAQACRANGIKNVAVTAGYINPAPRAEFFNWMDAANIDLKAFNTRFYQQLTGAQLEKVLETIQYAVNKTDCWVELTTLLIPNENDSEKEVTEMSEWILENCGDAVPLHFTRYHPDYRMMNHPPTPHNTLTQARDIAMKAGLKYVYIGNVIDPDRQATYCPHCGQKLIGRDYYQLSEWHLNQGQCSHCHTKIAGVFNDTPGNWGNQRRPVKLRN